MTRETTCALICSGTGTGCTRVRFPNSRSLLAVVGTTRTSRTRRSDIILSRPDAKTRFPDRRNAKRLDTLSRDRSAPAVVASDRLLKTRLARRRRHISDARTLFRRRNKRRAYDEKKKEHALTRHEVRTYNFFTKKRQRRKRKKVRRVSATADPGRLLPRESAGPPTREAAR